jgi:protein TonB
MRKLFVLGLVCCSLNVVAQKENETFYVYKKDWTAAKNFDDAVYFMHKVKENDSTYVCRTYNKTGPMITWETFADDSLKLPMGKFAWYNKDGKIDSAGDVYKGTKDGYWDYYSKGKREFTEEFYRGKRLKKWDYLNNTLSYEDGRIEKINKPKEEKKDTAKELVFTVVQTPAEFSGGVNAWIDYLQKNMKTPDRFLNLYSKRKYKGTVVVNFVINTSGFVDRIFIENSCEWSTDMEAIRVLKASPKWKPAVQNGKNVLYRHRQSLTFQVTEELYSSLNNFKQQNLTNFCYRKIIIGNKQQCFMTIG